MMIDFDCDEELQEFEFNYPTKHILEAKYKKYEKKTKNPISFEEFAFGQVKYDVRLGVRKYGEFENELVLLNTEITKFKTKPDILRLLIIYDLYLQYYYEGHPLPENII